MLLSVTGKNEDRGGEGGGGIFQETQCKRLTKDLKET